MNRIERDRKYVWHPYTQMKLANDIIAINSGQGAYLFDENNKKYIDAVSSWWVNIHGHSHPYIAEKVFKQLTTLEHVIFAGFTHEPAIQLAENLLSILPANQSKIFYSDNGSTAVEVALKMALQFWSNQNKKKNKILAFTQSYHGDTFGSMSVSSRSSFTEAFNDFLFDVIHIPLPAKGEEDKSISFLKNEIKKYKNEIAAFIYEPLVLGAGGMLMYTNEILENLLSVCSQNDILLIADEVMTGFGRTGKLFASDYMQIKPDIICVSKGITGGTMALGVTACTENIYNAFLSDDKSKALFHGHSYTANPVACAAANASFELLVKEECKNAITRITEKHKSFVQRNIHHPVIINMRQTGTIVAMEINNNEQVSYFNSLRDHLYNTFLKRGIILRPLGNTIYIMPPYCIEENDLDYIYKSIEEVADILI